MIYLSRDLMTSFEELANFPEWSGAPFLLTEETWQFSVVDEKYGNIQPDADKIGLHGRKMEFESRGNGRIFDIENF